MAWFRKTPKSEPREQISVVLKPLAGVSPRLYVPAAWIAAFLFAVFFLLLLPGLRRNGTWLKVESFPADASVLVDEIRAGGSETSLFIKKGSRVLTVRKPGFHPYKKNMDIRGRLLASRVFPRRQTIKVRFSPLETYDPINSGLQKFSDWADTGPERTRYAIPSSLTSAARDSLSGSKVNLELFAAAALPLAADARNMADVLRAAYILGENGAPPSGISLLSFLQKISLLFKDHPEWLNGILQSMDTPLSGSPAALAIQDSAEQEAQNIIQKFETEFSTQESFPIRRYGGIRFVEISSRTAPVGDMEIIKSGYDPRSGAEPAYAKVKTFFIGSEETTMGQYARFIEENPEWAASNVSSLQAEGLTDQGYMKSMPNRESYPQTEISWYAASAYAQWFTRRYLQNSGLTARLPREDEWEIAARLNGAAKSTSELPSSLEPSVSMPEGLAGIRGMNGNVREWAGNPYRKNENLYRPKDGSPSYTSSPIDNRAVRGGSFIDSNLLYPAAVRGSLPAQWTSPVVGFRLVLVNQP